jgi:hypothetical protein
MDRKEILNFLKENTSKFFKTYFETYFGIKLFSYQKILLNILMDYSSNDNNNIEYNRNRDDDNNAE